MKPVMMDVLSDASNLAVVRSPGRAFPGLVVQGDSLYNLTATAEAALRALEAGARDDAREHLGDVVEALRGRLEHYKAVMRAHSLELPFFEPAHPESE